MSSNVQALSTSLSNADLAGPVGGSVDGYARDDDDRGGAADKRLLKLAAGSSLVATGLRRFGEGGRTGFRGLGMTFVVVGLRIEDSVLTRDCPREPSNPPFSCMPWDVLVVLNVAISFTRRQT